LMRPDHCDHDCGDQHERAGARCEPIAKPTGAQLPRPRVNARSFSNPGLGREGIAEGVEVESAHGATSNDFRNAARPRDACVLTVPTEQPSVCATSSSGRSTR
jgi:hypothetical protein